ncbi:lysosomal acid phosphatase-like [Vespa velutina]|uniref:lysosomal acid phosphatase-like n=1 Tax=Vespa velutina TaxID=202808 RepID=UPI001FB33D82|nr:lysosomal acid phosphatase-like [Vespa velutina]XP_047362326.1 lysosomal acid phosphatase-like [Vespa velutina]XP_047362327.1 lysosomal acid phosphatase-like [Vespa velutina]XP_047362328.1 lysosomal acid phosphatase-like [Vespa velutina]
MDRKRMSYGRSCQVQQRGICTTLVFLVLIIGTILFAYTAFASSLKDDTIQQVIFLFRHGDRTPLKTYPSDPYKNYSWPGGWGALTTKGMRQLYNIGKRIRKMYSTTVGLNYNSTISFIRSSDSDRCIMSAQALLAGLYPPTPDQIFAPNLKWHPIPVHTVPRSMDKVIVVKAPCPKLKQELANAYVNESIKSDAELENYYNELTIHTQQPMKTITDIEFLYNILNIQAKNGLELPNWTKKFYNDEMRNIAARALTLLTSNTLLRRLHGGPLLKEIVNHMQESQIKKDSKKAYFYSVHDVTLVNLLRTMGFTNELFFPEYGATIIFELHSYSEKERAVKVFYLNSTESIKPHFLNIPNCEQPCLLSNLLKVWKDVIPVNWDNECIL